MNVATSRAQPATAPSGCWPAWARDQLRAAVAVSTSVRSDRPLATELYERWFAPASPVDGAPRALIGVYRSAHAGATISTVDGLLVLDRHDKIGRDGWWRTWNSGWRPRQSGARILLTPRADAAADVVGALTARLRDEPYLLACPADPARLSRSGAMVLYVPRPAVTLPDLLDPLAGLLRPDTPPLCLPLAPGISLAQLPGNGMTFGEHRCHVVALALGGAAGGRFPVDDDEALSSALSSIARTFVAFGIDPSRPYCSSAPQPREATTGSQAGSQAM